MLDVRRRRVAALLRWRGVRDARPSCCMSRARPACCAPQQREHASFFTLQLAQAAFLSTALNKLYVYSIRAVLRLDCDTFDDCGRKFGALPFLLNAKSGLPVENYANESSRRLRTQSGGERPQILHGAALLSRPCSFAWKEPPACRGTHSHAWPATQGTFRVARRARKIILATPPTPIKL